MDIQMVVDHQESTLKITRTIGLGDNAKSTTLSIDLSGKETSEVGPRGGTMATKASWDGDKLVVTMTRSRKLPNQQMTVENRQVWTLSKDGKTLTIQRIRKGPRGEKSRTEVYLKK
jgi:hypothetical protein